MIEIEQQQILLERAESGDVNALGELLQSFQDRLERIVHFRMDRRLSGRIDSKDVVQECFLEATKRFDYFVANQKSSFFLWVRYLALQKLAELHRHHLGAKLRSMSKEVSLFQKPNAAATSIQIAACLFDDKTSASQALIRDEARVVIESALSRMDSVDQEVLALRHFEQLSNKEVADSLGLDTSAASKRFVRALQRLRSIVEEHGID